MKLIDSLTESDQTSTLRLDMDTKESLFKEHMRNLFNQRVKDFRDLLDDSRHIINPESRWEGKGGVREQLESLDDERFTKFPERNRLHAF